jgi:Recombinase
LSQDIRRRPSGNILTRLAGNRHPPGLRRMLVLAMASALRDKTPAVSLDEFDDLSKLHRHEVLSHAYRLSASWRTATTEPNSKRDADAPRCKSVSSFVYVVSMSRRRLRRRTEKARRHTPSTAAAPLVVIREAMRVDRLAYTRTQAATALGISRSTFDRRVLPFVETVEMPSGMRLIPVDELKRLLAERRRASCGQPKPAKLGRPRAVPPELVRHLRAERAAGKSLGQIAHDLNSRGTPTAHGGGQWWPSTIRALLRRAP